MRGLLEIATNSDWHLEKGYSHSTELSEALRQIHNLLSFYTFEFGHRTFYESMRFAALHEAAGDGALDSILDRIMMQKLLPRIRGNRRRIEGLLLGLCKYCLDRLPWSSKGDVPGQMFDPESINVADVKLPISFEKLLRMLRSLRANQFTSFTE